MIAGVCRVFLLAFLVLSCSGAPSSPARRSPSPAPPLGSPASAPKPKEPLDPAYERLDTDQVYYAITEVGELRDYFLVTYHWNETGYCELGVSVDDGSVVGGCGFPATAIETNDVPSDKLDALKALEAEVLRRKPEASNIRVRFQGRYRQVTMDEFRPCDFGSKGLAHGHDYSRVSLHFDEDLREFLGGAFERGSQCGASYCYWCAPRPLWLPLRADTPLLPAPTVEARYQTLPAELLDAVRNVSQAPERPWPLPENPSE